MKRLIIAGVLLALILAVCLLSSFSVLSKIDGFKEDIKECERLYLAGDTAAAKRRAESFKIEWHNSSKTISAYTNHRPIDDIGILASMLPEAAGFKNDYEFAGTVERIKTELKIIYKEQSFNLANLY